MQYFVVATDDQRYEDRWFFDEVEDENRLMIDSRLFVYGDKYSGSTPKYVPIDIQGRRVAFNLGAFDCPVVTSEVAGILERFAIGELQRFPVTVAPLGLQGYEIVNITRKVKCVDEHRSVFTRFGNDVYQKRLIGKYQMFLQLRLDAAQCSEFDIFRIEDWVMPIIVSDRVREALCHIPDLGIVFVSVT